MGLSPKEKVEHLAVAALHLARDPRPKDQDGRIPIAQLGGKHGQHVFEIDPALAVDEFVAELCGKSGQRAVVVSQGELFDCFFHQARVLEVAGGAATSLCFGTIQVDALRMPPMLEKELEEMVEAEPAAFGIEWNEEQVVAGDPLDELGARHHCRARRQHG